MATLKEIEMRLKGTQNIKKITTSMKMVSAAKFAQAERFLKPARAYGGGAVDVYAKTAAEGPENVERQMIIAISSDRGDLSNRDDLCSDGLSQARNQREI